MAARRKAKPAPRKAARKRVTKPKRTAIEYPTDVEGMTTQWMIETIGKVDQLRGVLAEALMRRRDEIDAAIGMPSAFVPGGIVETSLR